MQKEKNNFKDKNYTATYTSGTMSVKLNIPGREMNEYGLKKCIHYYARKYSIKNYKCVVDFKSNGFNIKMKEPKKPVSLSPNEIESEK